LKICHLRPSTTLVTCGKGCHVTRVVLTASRDRFFNPCNPKYRHCYNTTLGLVTRGSAALRTLVTWVVLIASRDGFLNPLKPNSQDYTNV
jgi:hypothetical protein